MRPTFWGASSERVPTEGKQRRGCVLEARRVGGGGDFSLRLPLRDLSLSGPPSAPAPDGLLCVERARLTSTTTMTIDGSSGGDGGPGDCSAQRPPPSSADAPAAR
jgi:hypothetical protein